MVGSVVAFAVDPFWSCLRLDSDDVFAVELKEKVLDKPVLRPGGLLPLDNTPVQPSHNDKNAPTLSRCGGVWGNFCFGLDGCARPHNIEFAIQNV